MPKIKQPTKFTTVSIPIFLFKKIAKRIQKTGFPSVSGYVAYVLREIEAEKKKTNFMPKNIAKIKKKLKDLGY